MQPSSSRPLHLRCAILLATATAGPAAASGKYMLEAAPSPYRAALTAYHAEAIGVFSRSRDPFERMVAATLLADPAYAAAALGTDDVAQIAMHRDELVGAALLDAGDDVQVWWSAAMNCPAETPAVCERDTAMATLRALEPDNAAVWLDGLPRVTDDADEAAVDGQLLRASQATRFHVHTVARTVRLARAFERVPPGDALLASLPNELAPVADHVELGALAAFAVTIGESLPPTGPALHACTVETATRGRRDACKAIARIVTDNSDTMLGRNIGTKLGLRLARTQDEHAAARASALRLAWQTEAAVELQSELDSSGALIGDQMLRWLAPGATEVTAVQSLLIDNAVPLDPPDDWLPASDSWLRVPPAPAR